MIEYKIKEGDQSVNPLDVVIVKTGGTVEFTVGKINADVEYLQKSKKEIESQIGINKATMENVKKTHPHIAEMSNEDLTAAYLYREAMGVVTAGTEKVAEIDAQLEDYKNVKAEISKQTGLVIEQKNEEKKED